MMDTASKRIHLKHCKTSSPNLTRSKIAEKNQCDSTLISSSEVHCYQPSIPVMHLPTVKEDSSNESKEITSPREMHARTGSRSRRHSIALPSRTSSLQEDVFNYEQISPEYTEVFNTDGSIKHKIQGILGMHKPIQRSASALSLHKSSTSSSFSEADCRNNIKDRRVQFQGMNGVESNTEQQPTCIEEELTQHIAVLTKIGKQWRKKFKLEYEENQRILNKSKESEIHFTTLLEQLSIESQEQLREKGQKIEDLSVSVEVYKNKMEYFRQKSTDLEKQLENAILTANASKEKFCRELTALKFTNDELLVKTDTLETNMAKATEEFIKMENKHASLNADFNNLKVKNDQLEEKLTELKDKEPLPIFPELQLLKTEISKLQGLSSQEMTDLKQKSDSDPVERVNSLLLQIALDKIKWYEDGKPMAYSPNNAMSNRTSTLSPASVRNRLSVSSEVSSSHSDEDVDHHAKELVFESPGRRKVETPGVKPVVSTSLDSLNNLMETLAKRTSRVDENESLTNLDADLTQQQRVMHQLHMKRIPKKRRMTDLSSRRISEYAYPNNQSLHEKVQRSLSASDTHLNIIDENDVFNPMSPVSLVPSVSPRLPMSNEEIKTKLLHGHPVVDLDSSHDTQPCGSQPMVSDKSDQKTITATDTGAEKGNNTSGFGVLKKRRNGITDTPPDFNSTGNTKIHRKSKAGTLVHEVFRKLSFEPHSPKMKHERKRSKVTK